MSVVQAASVCGPRRRPRVLVAGAGNWLLAHDRAGGRVLELLERRYGEEVELVDIGCGALALLDHVDRQRLLVVVDACVGRGRPGEVVVETVDLDAAGADYIGLHQIGPVEALAVARHLQPEKMPGRVVLVLVETGALAEAEERLACERAVEEVDRLVEGALTAPRGRQGSARGEGG